MFKGRALFGVFLLMALTIGISTSSNLANADNDYVVVTPKQTHGWSTADTRPGGEVNFVSDSTAPGGQGALQLTTDATTTAKAQFLHEANTPLADVSELHYYTKQNSALFPGGDPSYQLITFLLGTSGFSTLVFEPYQNGAVIPGTWQQWDVDQGLFWSTRTVTCPNGPIVGTPGGPATYTLSAVQAACPNAVVIGFGVNIGTNNPGYDVQTDLFNFNGTVYDFEVARGCGRGQGEFRGHHGEGNFAVKAHCEGESDSFSTSNRGDGNNFQSTQVLSSVVDLDAGTITMTGVGSSVGGLPTTFTLVAVESGATPGAVSLTFGDGFVNAGDLFSGEVVLE